MIMAKLWERMKPRAMFIRKEIFYIILASIGGIILLIMLGFHYVKNQGQASHHQSTQSSGGVYKLASLQDTDWYKKHENQKQVAALPTSKVTLKNSVKTSMTSKEKSATVIQTAPTNDQDSEESEALRKAMTAPINAQQITGNQNTVSSAGNVSTGLQSSQSSGFTMPNQQKEDQNMQAEKKAFLQINGQPNLKDDYLGASLQNPLSQYELQAGTIIPGIMLSGIDSDLPGVISAQVESNVYDSISGKYLLVPQGSKLQGVYDSQIAYGQERILIAWQRIIFPNGKSIDLQGMPGEDLSGYAGFHDQVDNHYIKIFGSVILMSVLSAGAQLSQPQNQTNSIFQPANPTVGQTLAQSLGTNITNTATQLTQKNVNIQPTLKIRQGYEFNIAVTKDMVFQGAYAG